MSTPCPPASRPNPWTTGQLNGAAGGCSGVGPGGGPGGGGPGGGGSGGPGPGGGGGGKRPPKCPTCPSPSSGGATIPCGGTDGPQPPTLLYKFENIGFGESDTSPLILDYFVNLTALPATVAPVGVLVLYSGSAVGGSVTGLADSGNPDGAVDPGGQDFAWLPFAVQDLAAAERDPAYPVRAIMTFTGSFATLSVADFRVVAFERR